MDDLIAVRLSAWVIKDGSYNELAPGDTAAFALEFDAPVPLTPCEPGHPWIVPIANNCFAVCAQVVHVTETWWAIDAGLLSFDDGPPPPGVQPGQWLRGEIELEIDHDFYAVGAATEAGAPALIYDWRIEQVLVQTAPRIEVRPRLWQYDPARLAWGDIPRTNAQQADAHTEYLLRCRRLPGRPRRTRMRPTGAP